jgi:hypothetical protein
MKKFAAILLLLGAMSAFAQRRQPANYVGGGFNIPGMVGGNCLVPGTRRYYGDDTPEPRDIDRTGFVYGRFRYSVLPGWRGDIPWHHDYPDGDTMLPDALQRLTKVSTNPESYQIVDIDSKEIFKYPFIYLAEPGFLDLRPPDIKNLRQYIDRGGFVFVDDFRGRPGDDNELQNFIEQVRKLYPSRELKPVPKSHEIFHTFFDIDATNMVPPYRMNNQGDLQFLGMSDDEGRLFMMVDYNNDLSEYWQALDVGTCSINESSMAVQLGVNYVVYAMTH